MSEMRKIWSDIRRGDWVDTRLPNAMRPYARLMRLDRPIGTWLLLLPCWWGVVLAGQGGIPNIGLMILFALGAIVMRGAGCVVNDLYDRKLDAQVERTSTRPLASGEVKPWQAILLLFGLLCIGFLILCAFNRATIIAGAASLLLVFIYPLMKRVTWWPQLFLGLTFNWGALLGWISVRGELGWPALLLYVAGIAWTLAYDTIYAHQDAEDDRKVGIKSTALLFGERSPRIVGGFYALFLMLLVLVGIVASLSAVYYWCMAVIALGVLAIMWQWDVNSPPNCLARFKNNRDIGLLVFIALLLGRW